MTRLGRSGSVVTFTSNQVQKVTTDLNEPVQMLLYPDVYAPVLDVRVTHVDATYVMPRLASPGSDPHVLLQAARELKQLWSYQRAWRNASWRERLTLHLATIGQAQQLRHVIDCIRVISLDYVTHGDPTLANLAHDGQRYRWLDPLVRDYIPGDPHVDLGKLFQSCWGYERCLVDPKFTPTFDRALAVQLADSLDLDFEQGWAWCAVHVARLLRYQETRVANEFRRVLCALCST